jgi:hypothetical protein
LPSPSELGVAPASLPKAETNTGFDQRLQQLHATNLQVVALPQGGFRARFLLPGSHGAPSQPVEADGPSNDAAVNLALDRAELSLRR